MARRRQYDDGFLNRGDDYPNVAGAKEETTSRQAANEIEDSGRAEQLRARVFQWYRRGGLGTADECAAALKESILAIRPRVSELHKQGLLIETGTRRRSDGGGYAHVWKLDQRILVRT